MKRVELPGAHVRVYKIPATALGAGQLVELKLPRDWSADDTKSLVAMVASASANVGIDVAVADTLQSRRLSLVDRLWRRTAERVVAVSAGIPVERARAACAECGVQPSAPVTHLTWTDRKLLDYEVSVSPNVVVIVDDLGLDPGGEERFAAHVRRSMSANAVIALKYPLVGLDGAVKAPPYKPSWSSLSLEVSGR